jgi:Tol biopolymer transport system component
MPAWSADGQKIAFHALGAFPTIRVIDADGSNERMLGRGLAPSWSPDGTKIAFFVRNLEDGSVRQLIPEAEAPVQPDYCDFAPAWSRVRR